MIQLRSIIKPADNCGARSVQVVHIYKGHFHKKGTIGDIVLAVVKDAIPNGLVQKKEKVISLVKLILKVNQFIWIPEM